MKAVAATLTAHIAATGGSPARFEIWCASSPTAPATTDNASTQRILCPDRRPVDERLCRPVERGRNRPRLNMGQNVGECSQGARFGVKQQEPIVAVEAESPWPFGAEPYPHAKGCNGDQRRASPGSPSPLRSSVRLNFHAATCSGGMARRRENARFGGRASNRLLHRTIESRATVIASSGMHFSIGLSGYRANLDLLEESCFAPLRADKPTYHIETITGSGFLGNGQERVWCLTISRGSVSGDPTLPLLPLILSQPLSTRSLGEIRGNRE